MRKFKLLAALLAVIFVGSMVAMPARAEWSNLGNSAGFVAQTPYPSAREVKRGV